MKFSIKQFIIRELIAALKKKKKCCCFVHFSCFNHQTISFFLSFLSFTSSFYLFYLLQLFTSYVWITSQSLSCSFLSGLGSLSLLLTTNIFFNSMTSIDHNYIFDFMNVLKSDNNANSIQGGEKTYRTADQLYFLKGW